MTVSVLVKVFDGIVLATDSATTLGLPDGSAQVYNSADKIFQLHRALPIGAMTWGLGQIGSASISTLAKDLRRRLMGRDADHADWQIDPASYTIQQVGERLVEMLEPLFKASYGPGPSVQPLCIQISGYSAGSTQSEAWLVSFRDPSIGATLELVAGTDTGGWVVNGQPEAATRLFHGWDPRVIELGSKYMTEADQALFEADLRQLAREPAIPSMPFPDAIALAKYLVEVTAGYSHFLLGPDTVGGADRHRWLEPA